MKKTYEYVVPLAECKHKSVVVGVGSIESSFLIQVKFVFISNSGKVRVFPITIWAWDNATFSLYNQIKGYNASE
jgi:hypothetical protein